MITCNTCKKLDRCTRLCPAVESLLPKEETGKDARHEVKMDTDAFMAVVERYSYAEWRHEEHAAASPRPDLSVLTRKERNALLLLASGLSMREAARRLKINLKSFQKRVSAGRRDKAGLPVRVG